MANDTSALNAALRAKRRERGLNQRQLAKLLGCSHQFVSEVESGKRTLPKRWNAVLTKKLPGWGDVLLADGDRLAVAHAPPAAATPAAPPAPVTDAKAIAVAVLTKLSARLESCTAAELPAIARAIAPHASLLAKVAGQFEASEAQILRSTAWQRLMKVLDGVLERHPVAASDWSRALAEALR